MDNLKEATLQSELHFKDLVINPCHRSVLINNNRIGLTTKEFDLLYFLAIHPGWAFTKSQIYGSLSNVVVYTGQKYFLSGFS